MHTYRQPNLNKKINRTKSTTNPYGNITSFIKKNFPRVKKKNQNIPNHQNNFFYNTENE